MYGRLDEVGIIVVVRGEFGDDGRGDVEDVFGVFGCFVEGAGGEEVGYYDEREVGEAWSCFEDTVGFRSVAFCSLRTTARTW